jgi:hypothetical protein
MRQTEHLLVIADPPRHAAASTVIVNNGVQGSPTRGKKNRAAKSSDKKDSGDDESSGSDRWVGAAVIAVAVVSGAVGFGRVWQRAVQLSRLSSRRQALFVEHASECVERDAARLLVQYDATFGALRTSALVQATALIVGSGSVALAGSLYYFGCERSAAYFPLVCSACASAATAAWALVFLESDASTDARRLHTLCANFLQRAGKRGN